MANLNETAQWETGIYQLETSDPVMGGPDGIDNRQAKQLANRTLWLKKQTEALQTASDDKAAASTAINAGGGLTGGGSLAQSRTIALGAPGQITATSQNAVQENSHTHAIDTATTTRAGIVQLDNTVSEAENTAATPKAVKTALDQALAAAAAANLKVSLSGDQTVNGQKTFTAQTQFQSGIHLSANQTNWNGGHKAYIGADADNAHIVFGDDTLRLHSANNRISYNNHDIFHKANKPRFAEDIEGKPNTLSGYGIGNFKVETFRGDLNTLKTDGIYSLPTAVGSSNLPVENTACHIQVIAGTQPGWCRQLGYPAYTSDVYERHQVSSANDNWSAWKKLNSDGIPVGAIVSFPKAVRNPAGYLRADGTTFAQNTFPDLYRALGNSNRLPDLSRTDIGITAWFPSDQIPTGWLAFDDIRTRVTETAYPELYRLLTGKYGSIQNVPQAEDRFIRNAGNSLAVGTKQEDEIKRHTHKVFSHWTSHTDVAAVGYEDGNERQRSALVSTWTDENLSDNGFLTPRLDSKMATGGDENRPKALVLKLCIKAADTLGEAVFWIKSHGETVNAGALDAGTLAQGLQDKADRDHTHTAAQIQGLDEKISTAVAAQFTRQTIGGVDIVRFPDGTMIQTGSYRFTRSGGPIENEVVFPVAFADGNVKCFVSERHSERVTGDRRQHNWLFIRAKNHAAAIITNWYEGSCDWMAIGKAASGNAASSPIVPEIPETNEEPQRESGRTSTGPRNRRRHRDGLLEALQD
ncbi:TPA: tail fiber protein [Neisseria meningitidis]|uniref:tail fiber protein n=2 Tax=Neisseria meningitidis TaxID=487 RepID=UPI000C3247AE|nr:tail fiber protein [Neisseria meningitidis]